MTGGWREHFDSLRPDSPLYRRQAEIYLTSLSAALQLHPDDRVLDFGCGLGFVPALLAARVGEVWWWEPSANMRALAERTLAGVGNAMFCDLSGLPFAESHRAARHEWRFDAILVNSVAQYMTRDELWAWLPCWRRMVTPGGAIVLSDLIPLGHTGLSDAVDLVRLGIRCGSPLSASSGALGGVTRYWRTRRAAPLTTISRGALTSHAAGASLGTEFLASNLTHFRRRWTAVLRPRPSPQQPASSVHYEEQHPGPESARDGCRHRAI